MLSATDCTRWACWWEVNRLAFLHFVKYIYGKSDQEKYVTGCYYGRLLFMDLTQKQPSGRKQEWYAMAITGNKLQRWENNLSKMGTSWEGIEHGVGVIPVPFCSIRYVKNKWYLLGSEHSVNDTLQLRRQYRGLVYQIRWPGSYFDLQSHQIPSIWAVRSKMW